ncbi:YihY family inner membrane protein [Ferruginivarius sediminum]|uniref:UPF0761 membrane protein DRB17_07840 n=2 Tax=Ferruginivarius sediminum TaxID=2661937 RepID=A0A369TDU7_9PROT|nr:YihY family inner membrane protein [Ferruginivarius sediminum]
MIRDRFDSPYNRVMTFAQLVRQMSGYGTERALRRLLAWLRYVTKGERVLRFLAYAGARFLDDGGMRLAAGLSYASLLAMVPLLAIALAILSAFPAFEGVERQVLDMVFQSFLPDASAAIAERIKGFVANASKLTGPGIVGLAVTALLLLNNISGSFNTIWRVSEGRPLATRMLVYWALLTLGPLLLGSSISLSSFVFAAVKLSGVEEVASWLRISWLISLALSAAGFALIFYVVPNRRISLGHVLVGGTVSALLFEGLKYAFGLYLTHFPSYEAVYGAISTVPIFLVWLYLSWSVVLLGAEVTAALPEWRAAQARGRATSPAGGRLALALAVLARLRAAMQTGQQMKRQEMTRGLPATPAEIDAVLKPLRQQGFIARTQNGRWVIGRDLNTATLGDLLDTLGLSLEPGEGWPPVAAGAVRELAEESSRERRQTLEVLLRKGK